MNLSEYNLLLLIESALGATTNATDYTHFDKIIEAIKPFYDRDKILLDPTTINGYLSSLVNQGYLESTNRSYRFTPRGRTYAIAYPLVDEMVKAKIQELDQDNGMILQRAGIVVAILFSLIALLIVLFR